MQIRWRGAFFLVLGVILAGCTRTVKTPPKPAATVQQVVPHPAASLRVGQPAPEIEGEDIDGRVFKLSDYRGKVVLLDFWGHW